MSFHLARTPTIRMRSSIGGAKLALCYLTIFVLSAWSVLALFFDFHPSGMRLLAVTIYLSVLIALLIFFKLPLQRLLASLLCFGVALLWWLNLAPSNNGQWQADVSRTAYAEIDGSRITFYNVRSCDYRAQFEYTCQWLTRQIDLDHVWGVDLFMDYWGSPWIAHTIVSFDLRPDPSEPDANRLDHIAFSIEARKHVGQKYSSIRSFFRQFTLISVVSDERDVVRLRTDYRHNEDLYLYHTTAPPAFARSLLLDYVAFTNQLHNRPQWYNAITHNCTTQILTFKVMKGRPFDWRILLNGKADEMLYEQGELATELPGQSPSAPRMSFIELKRRAYINLAAQAAKHDPAFSERIRENRPGFGTAELEK
ncbi:MAG: DUF4105 domain-containing protein [Terracidiphilus sp.]